MDGRPSNCCHPPDSALEPAAGAIALGTALLRHVTVAAARGRGPLLLHAPAADGVATAVLLHTAPLLLRVRLVPEAAHAAHGRVSPLALPALALQHARPRR